MLETVLEKSITSVPYSAINRFESGFMESWLKRVESITINTQFVGGEWIKKLEARLAKEAQTTEARVCANGTDAIQLALRAFGVGEGDTVLIPDSTFWATFEAVCNVGARPITMDICQNDLHVTVETVEESLKKFSPKAVILVHLYGWVAKDTVKIRNLCREKNIPLIEDSAQAWGATIDGESVFKNAHISTTSFYPGKVFGGAGDGGAIFTNDTALAEKVRLFANHGRTSKYEHHWVGWNSRLDGLQCAFLDLTLDHIPARIHSRVSAINWYRKNMHIPALKFMQPAENVKENGYISVATIDPQLRKKLIEGLQLVKIGYEIIYPAPISKQPGAEQWIAGKVSNGNTEKVCQSIINLPCFAGMKMEELEYVKHHIERILK